MRKLQQEIMEATKVQAVIEPEVEIQRSVSFMKRYLRAHPFLTTLVLGISGGQDSTLTGKLAQLAVEELNGEEGTERYRFVAVRLPYGVQRDEADCEAALDFIRPSKTVTVNIKPAVDASVQSLREAGVELSDFLKGNEKARERMKVQYSIAGTHQGVVLGTDHSAENVTGFYTKFGDGAADLIPIFRLNKRQGKQLLQALGCPAQLYTKVPTADLEEDQPQLPDERSLGVTYEEIDDYLEGKAIAPERAEVIEAHYVKTAHKRHEPISVFDEWWCGE